MKRLGTIVYHANRILSKPVTLVLIFLMFFSIYLYGVSQTSRTNQAILREISAAVKNTERLLQNVEQAGVDQKADNAQQTIILCKLILGGSVNITGPDALEVERICNERINQNDQRQPGNNSNPPVSGVPALVAPRTASEPPVQPQTTSAPPDPAPAPAEQPGVVTRVVDTVTGAVTSTLDALGRLF